MEFLTAKEVFSVRRRGFFQRASAAAPGDLKQRTFRQDRFLTGWAAWLQRPTLEIAYDVQHMISNGGSTFLR